MSLKLGLLGLGTVGGGTVDVLRKNAAHLQQQTGQAIEVVRAAVRDPAKARACDLSHVQVDSDAEALVADPNVDVVVELMGGVTRAHELVIAALNNGKSVVTANKALIAEHGAEIFQLAQEKGLQVVFEAAVAGGIPIIKALREGLAGNQISEIAGIINGTTNFILTRVESDGAAFADVLVEAQAKGYAEADPTFDVEGIDAGHKLAILASLAFDMQLATAELQTVGVGKVSVEDISHADELGYRIKHLAVARLIGEDVELRVEPTLVPKDAFVAKVDGVMNGVAVKGDAIGTAGFYGPGAGALATASAVVADIADLARNHFMPVPSMSKTRQVIAQDKVVSGHYLRMRVVDRAGVMSTISSILAQHDVSIEAMVQKETTNEQAEVVLLTHDVAKGQLDSAMKQLAASDVVDGAITHLRVEQLSE